MIWRRKWQSTPVFLPGQSHGERCLASYSPWGCKEMDMTKQLSMRANDYPSNKGLSPLPFWLSSISVCLLVAQSCPTLCDHVDCSPPGSSVHGILQARILQWVAMASSREPS